MGDWGTGGRGDWGLGDGGTGGLGDGGTGGLSTACPELVVGAASA